MACAGHMIVGQVEAVPDATFPRAGRQTLAMLCHHLDKAVDAQLAHFDAAIITAKRAGTRFDEGITAGGTRRPRSFLRWRRAV